MARTAEPSVKRGFPLAASKSQATGQCVEVLIRALCVRPAALPSCGEVAHLLHIGGGGPMTRDRRLRVHHALAGAALLAVALLLSLLSQGMEHHHSAGELGRGEGPSSMDTPGRAYCPGAVRDCCSELCFTRPSVISGGQSSCCSAAVDSSTPYTSFFRRLR